MAAPRLRSISFFRPSFFFAVFALPVFPLFAQGPTYVHIPSFVNEYELDRLMSETPWDWRDLFRSVPTGFQASANSLNIRHLLVEETLKARFPLGDRWSFRVRHLQTHVLERRETATEVEFEYSPLSRWYFSFFGEPTFHKADATAGLAARWGLDEGRSIRLAYAWPRFDANYAFENRSVNEGYQEFYRRFPQEARLQAAWIPGAWSVYLTGRFSRPWELDHIETSPALRYISRGESSEAAFDLRGRPEPWTWTLDGETWREKESIDFEPASPSSNRALVQERSMFRGAVERRFGENWKARAGGLAVGSRGTLRFPLQAALDQRYSLRDRIAFLRVYRRLGARSWLETGYAFDRQRREERFGTAPAAVKNESHNRGRLGYQKDWINGASLRILSAIELDSDQAERFFSFDGWTVQFQTTFE